MSRYLVRRLTEGLIAVLGITLVIFVLLRCVPGDPARVMLPEAASEEDVEAMRRHLGLDLPIPVQYVRFLGQLVRADLGRSFEWGIPVVDMVVQRMPATAELAVVSVLLASAVGVPAGVIVAANRNRIVKFCFWALTVLAQSMPAFWIGILLIEVFAVKFRVLPSSGRGTVRHLVLPAVALAIQLFPLIARLTHSSLTQVLSSDYIKTARSKGLSEKLVLYKHALRNGVLPVITVIGLQFGSLLGGAVITEAIFAWPGVGRMTLEAINGRDYAVVQASVLILAIAFVAINILVDVAYALLDPRIRYGGHGSAS